MRSSSSTSKLPPRSAEHALSHPTIRAVTELRPESTTTVSVLVVTAHGGPARHNSALDLFLTMLVCGVHVSTLYITGALISLRCTPLIAAGDDMGVEIGCLYHVHFQYDYLLVFVFVSRPCFSPIIKSFKWFVVGVSRNIFSAIWRSIVIRAFSAFRKIFSYSLLSLRSPLLVLINEFVVDSLFRLIRVCTKQAT